MKLDTSAAPELALLATPATGSPAARAAGAALPGTAEPGIAVTGTTYPGPASRSQTATSLAGAAGPGEDDRPRGGSDPARLAEGGRPGCSAGPAALAGPVTVGYLAACLRFLVADPGRWWDLVRFAPQHPMRIPVAAPAPGCETWLLVLPPGFHGETAGLAPGSGVSCLVAGAVTERAAAPDGWQDRPLTPGRTRVHRSGGRSRLINSGAGYAVTLHARPLPR